MLSVKNAKLALKIILPIFIAIFSICILANTVSQSRFVEKSVESLDQNKNTVIEFTGATMATSLAISALPDDFASPLANSLADMNKYFVVILAVTFLERMILLEGTKLALIYVIPIACGIYILSLIPKMEFVRNFSIKLVIFGMALIFAIPCSTYLVDTIGADYMAYVEETIVEAEDGADKINELIASGDEDATFFEKLSNAFKTAIQGVTDLIDYFNSIIKKCMNSIAVLLVTTCVVPICVLFFFKWLLKELFSISLPKVYGHNDERKTKKTSKKEANA